MLGNYYLKLWILQIHVTRPNTRMFLKSNNFKIWDLKKNYKLIFLLDLIYDFDLSSFKPTLKWIMRLYFLATTRVVDLSLIAVTFSETGIDFLYIRIQAQRWWNDKSTSLFSAVSRVCFYGQDIREVIWLWHKGGNKYGCSLREI